MSKKMILDKLVESTLQNVVAAEPGEQNTAVLFIREKDACRKQEIPFKPFIIVSDPKLLLFSQAVMLPPAVRST